jgi:hypothetical protein
MEMDLVVVDKNYAHTVEFTAPGFDSVRNYSIGGKAPIFVEILDEDENTLFSDFTVPVAYLLESISSGLNQRIILTNSFIN